MTDEFGIPDLEEPNTQPPTAKGGKKKPVKIIDPEDDKKNWPVIFIDFEDGLPNYQYCAASGTKKNGQPFTHSLQVQRGVDVAVPPSIVNMLRDSVEARYSQTPDPVTGRMSMNKTARSGLPWHIVEKGKYIK
jgi:hypothetical protein